MREMQSFLEIISQKSAGGMAAAGVAQYYSHWVIELDE